MLQGLRPSQSVRVRLFFLHVFIVAPFIVLGALWTGDAALGEKSHMVGQVEERASKVAAITTALVQEEITVLKTVSELPPIEQGNAPEAAVVLSSLLSHHPLQNNLFVLDASGTRVASSIPHAGPNEPMGESDLFKEVMQTGQPFVGRAAIAREGRSAGSPVVPIGVPVRDRSGRQIGVLVGELVLSEVQRLMELGADPAGGYVYISDRAGQVIAHPDTEQARVLRDFSAVPPVQELLEGEEGSSEYVDPFQKKRLFASYRKVPIAGWGIVSTYPSEAISATMMREGVNILAIVGLALTSVLLAAYVVGNRMADRIASVASAARALRVWEAGEELEVAGQDEIGMIARSLTAFSGQLRRQSLAMEEVVQALQGTCEDVGEALARGLDVEEALRLAMQSAARLAGTEAAVGLLAQDGEDLRVVKALGPIPSHVLGQLWPLDDQQSILGQAIRQHQSQQIADLSAQGLPPDSVVALGREGGFRVALVVPMVAHGRSLGVLVLFDSGLPRQFGDEAIRRIETIAGQAAVAIENSQLQQQIRVANEQMMLAGLRLRTIIETIPEGVVVAEAPSGSITMSNTSAEQLLGRKIMPDIDLHQQPREYGLYTAEGRLCKDEELPLYRSVVSGKTDTREIVVKHLGGEDVTLLFSSAPLRDLEGRVIGGVGVFRDISEMKELDRLKDEFISITSHELKSPLTVIGGYAQLLLRKVGVIPEREQEAQWLQAIANQSTRLAGLVERLLDVSRIQAGRLELIRAPMDIVALARDVAQHEQITTTKHQIRVYAEAPELVGNWDRPRVEEVLINLIDNAIKYSPRGGPIEIDVRRIDSEVQVSVQDHGAGIAKEDVKRIFEKFYRARIERDRPKGLGLGLYVSYQIVTMHRGRMWVESEPGRGSTFYFTLPLSEDRPAVKP